MINYPQIDPVLVTLGPVLGKSWPIHWYGVMYLLGFLAAFWIAHHRSRRADSPVKPEQVEDLILYGALGVVLGGRLGYVFFYGFEQFIREPLWLFKIWTGGMSFHGGLLGVIVAMWLYTRKIRCTLFQLTDFIAPMVPVGLGLGRIGNFINQELWGRASDVSWAMIFPNDPLSFPRHPSQLYQFALEGVALFVILFWFSQKPRPRAATSALFLFFYGSFRFIVEFFREPDSHIGFDSFGWMTRGQELCLPMIVGGALLLWWAYRRTAVISNPAPAMPVESVDVAEPVAAPVVKARKPARAKPKTEPKKELKPEKVVAAKPALTRAPAAKSRVTKSAPTKTTKATPASAKEKESKAKEPKQKEPKEKEVKKSK